jgi:hypothetical protein
MIPQAEERSPLLSVFIHTHTHTHTHTRVKRMYMNPLIIEDANLRNRIHIIITIIISRFTTTLSSSCYSKRPSIFSQNQLICSGLCFHMVISLIALQKATWRGTTRVLRFSKVSCDVSEHWTSLLLILENARKSLSMRTSMRDTQLSKINKLFIYLIIILK